jgi:hypothetical protein
LACGGAGEITMSEEGREPMEEEEKDEEEEQKRNGL